jgi:hypothetical protein
MVDRDSSAGRQSSPGGWSIAAALVFLGPVLSFDGNCAACFVVAGRNGEWPAAFHGNPSKGESEYGNLH